MNRHALELGVAVGVVVGTLAIIGSTSVPGRQPAITVRGGSAVTGSARSPGGGTSLSLPAEHDFAPSTTAPGPPTPPLDTNAYAGDSAVEVRWQAPADDGGSPISSYSVIAQPGHETATVPADGRSIQTTVIRGLTNAVAYRFAVFATNALGSSTGAAPPYAVTPFGSPGPPRRVHATASDGAVLVSWTPPAHDNGSRINTYLVASSPADVLAGVNAAHDAVEVTGLATGRAYTFTVTAENSAASGPPSARSNAIVVRGAR